MTCQDAPQLLKERREAAIADNAERVKAIDDERFAHAEVSPDCRCWMKAIADAAQGVLA